jgi:hypothetical protein
VADRLRIVEGLALPREEDESKLTYYNSLTTWISLDPVLALDPVLGEIAPDHSATGRNGARRTPPLGRVAANPARAAAVLRSFGKEWT